MSENSEVRIEIKRHMSSVSAYADTIVFLLHDKEMDWMRNG